MAHLYYRNADYKADRPEIAQFWASGPYGWGHKITHLEPRVRKTMLMGVVFALGWASSTIYYQVPRLWAQKTVLTRELHCEHTRAQGAIASAEADRPLSRFVTTDCLHKPQP